MVANIATRPFCSALSRRRRKGFTSPFWQRSALPRRRRNDLRPKAESGAVDDMNLEPQGPKLTLGWMEKLEKEAIWVSCVACNAVLSWP